MLALLALVSFGHLAWGGAPLPTLLQRNLYLLAGGRFFQKAPAAPPDPLIAMLGTENERLHELLALRSRLPGKANAAVVARREPETWWSELVVEFAVTGPAPTGTAIVLTPQGLIGTLESDALVVVREAGQTFCRGTVRLLSSQETQLSVVVGEGESAFLLEGRGGSELALRPLTSGAEKAISPGDPVQTSGLGKLYSKGLQVAQVARDPHLAMFTSLASTPPEVLLWWR
jgi:cell shape-determining protein MreC